MNELVISLLIILVGYLMGSIPTAYLVGRWLKGIDLRKYGSGTVSGSMVFEHVSKWSIIPVGLFDIFKGAFPTWLGMELMNSPFGAAIGGIAAVIGHNWPIFLNFTGGRGLSPFMGSLLIVFPPGVLWMLLLLGIGYLLGDSAPITLVSLLTLPLLNHQLNGLEITNSLIGVFFLVTLLKRLEANNRPLPEDKKERRKVIALRLLFDRDIPNHRDWISRSPQ